MDEQRRLIREATRNADVVRRRWPFALEVSVTFLLFGLAPRVPGAAHVFGALTATQALLFVAPAILATGVCLFLYRRASDETRVNRREKAFQAYAVAEAFEAFCLYGSLLGFIYGAQKPWTVLWMLCAFTALFWASTKPFHTRMYLTAIAAGHALLLLASVLRGSPSAAIMSIAGCALSCFVHLAVSRTHRRHILLEAERNSIQVELNRTLFRQEREQITRALQSGVGREIARLADELDADLAAQARTTLAELHAVTARRNLDACTLAELARRVDERCAPLAATRRYEAAREGDETALIGAAEALACLRVAQEFVRNAVVHGDAHAVFVTLEIGAESALILTVCDDGSGLSKSAFVQATGGLHNARRWAEACGGSLTHHEAAASTCVRASFPKRRS